MPRQAALGHDETRHPLGVYLRGIRGGEIARDDHRPDRHGFQPRGVEAGDTQRQPPLDIVEIVGALAQILILKRQKLVPLPLDRVAGGGGGGTARANRLDDPLPQLLVGENGLVPLEHTRQIVAAFDADPLAQLDQSARGAVASDEKGALLVRAAVRRHRLLRYRDRRGGEEKHRTDDDAGRGALTLERAH